MTYPVKSLESYQELFDKLVNGEYVIKVYWELVWKINLKESHLWFLLLRKTFGSRYFFKLELFKGQKTLSFRVKDIEG